MKIRYLLPLILFTTAMMKQPEFKLGIENISPQLVHQLKDKRIGLITNQTGINQSGKRTIDILYDSKVPISYLFAPEHGIAGAERAEVAIKDSVDEKTKVPIISLYKASTGRQIDESYLAAIDTILFDIQDSGMRHYTYISTLYQALQTASSADKDIIVFDRPNPLASPMEGPLVEPHLKSFISITSIPLRHGMTIGEIAQYFNRYELSKPARLQVVPMKHYDRTKPFFLNALSPNISKIESCFGYSFLGLLGEIKPFDVGVGTQHAFTYVTLPKEQSFSESDWQQLSTILGQHGIACSPCESQKADSVCKGLKLTIEDIDNFKAFSTFIDLVEFFTSKKVSLSFSSCFDKAMGNSLIQQAFQNNSSLATLKQGIKEQLDNFYEKARAIFLYKPYPRVMEWE